MTNKAYIVANEQQEREVLNKLEEKGALWQNGENAVNFIPFRTFPYVIYCNGDKFISWDNLGDLDVDKIIVFDGRNEEHMSEKYVVSQEFMTELEEWKARLNVNERYYVFEEDVYDFPSLIETWWKYRMSKSDKETNNRLIAIIRWVNGEDVFEVEKPTKWVVRSKDHNNFGEYTYVTTDDIFSLAITMGVENATRFDTKEEAQSWANAHQEVIEAEE